MNQILSTENTKNKKYNSNKKDIKSIIKFFAIILAIFGIFIIANSAYAMYKNGGEIAKSQEKAKPEIQISNESEEIIDVSVTYKGEIKEVEYYWNEPEKSQVVDAKGQDKCQLKLEVPNGDNTLTVIVKGVDGEEEEYTQSFSIKKSIEIEMKQSGNNLKITIKGKETLKEIKYTWDNDEEKKMDANEAEFSFEIDEIEPGTHNIKVTAEDVKGNKEEKSKKVKGTVKPTISAKIVEGEDCYTITAHDDVGLDRIEITTVEDGKTTTIKSDGKDFEYKFPLKENNLNRITIKAYNTDEAQSDVKAYRCKR